MEEQDPAKQALMEMFRHDRAEAQAHPRRPPRWELSSRTRAWLLGIALVVFIIAPFTFIIVYPRLGPVDTMTSFCRAETDGEYATAYALLSQQAQRRVSLDAFTHASEVARLISCSTTHGIPIILGGSQASLDVTYQLYSSAIAVDGTMSFVRESGGWRVDSMSPDLFHLSS